MRAIGVLVLVFFTLITADDEFHVHRKKVGISARAGIAPMGPIVNEMESSIPFWMKKAQSSLATILEEKINTNKAKNIIFLIGDGMSIPTVAATRMYLGKEENELSFEKFPFYGLAKTYCVNYQVPDRYAIYVPSFAKA